MVGPTGFEPATSPTPRERATKLRYGPTIRTLYEEGFHPARLSLLAIFLIHSSQIKLNLFEYGLDKNSKS